VISPRCYWPRAAAGQRTPIYAKWLQHSCKNQWSLSESPTQCVFQASCSMQWQSPGERSISTPTFSRTTIDSM